MPDRRQHVRTPTSLHAELRMRTSREVYGCTVLDRSDGGVQIDLEEDLYLPEELTIRFSDGASQLVRRCWSSGTRSGFQFIDAEPEPSPSIDAAAELLRAFTFDNVRITPETVGFRGERMDMLCSAELIHAFFTHQPQIAAVTGIGTGADVMRQLSASQHISAPAEMLNFFGPDWRKFFMN